MQVSDYIWDLFPIQNIFIFCKQAINNFNYFGNGKLTNIYDLTIILFDAIAEIFIKVYLCDPNNTYSIEIFFTWLSTEGIHGINDIDKNGTPIEKKFIEKFVSFLFENWFDNPKLAHLNSTH